MDATQRSPRETLVLSQGRHPPDDRRPSRRSPRVAGRAHDAAGPRGRGFDRTGAPLSRRLAGPVRDLRHLHRRREGSGRVRGEVQARERRRLAHRDAVLVLRLGDDGHGPAPAEGGVGLQRHRAAGRGLSRRRPRRPHPERPAGFRDLRQGRASRDRHGDPRRCPRQAARFRPLRTGGRPDARPVLSFDGRHLDGHRRLGGRSRDVGKVARHAGRGDRHERVRRPDEEGLVRPR